MTVRGFLSFGGLYVGLALDHVRTNFGNSASNTQNDLRLAVGVTYHFGER
jgi:hypothetical protein